MGGIIMDNLYLMTYKCQRGDKDSLMKIICKFKPLIQKYSRKLNYDDAEDELILGLVETVIFLPIDTKEYLKKDECIVGYINMSIKNRYINLSKKYCQIYNLEMELNEDINIKGNENIYISVENKIFIKDILNKLTSLQKEVVIKKFFKEYKDNEIAKQLGISRQAVNRIKNRALKKMKLECVVK